MTREQAQIETPIGVFRAVVVDGAVQTAGFQLGRKAAPRDAGNAVGVRDRLAAYFTGDVDALDDIDVAPEGTLFKQLVWKALRRCAAADRPRDPPVAAARAWPGIVSPAALRGRPSRPTRAGRATRR